MSAAAASRQSELNAAPGGLTPATPTPALPSRSHRPTAEGRRLLTTGHAARANCSKLRELLVSPSSTRPSFIAIVSVTAQPPSRCKPDTYRGTRRGKEVQGLRSKGCVYAHGTSSALRTHLINVVTKQTELVCGVCALRSWQRPTCHAGCACEAAQ